MAVPDTVTIIRSQFMLLAKRIHVNGRIDPYGSAKTIDLFERHVSDLTALHELIVRLIPKPRCAVVYGGIADPERVRRVRRLSKADLQTGDLPTLRPVRHRWCALDLDGVERPLDVPAHDLAACAEFVVSRLPVAFQGVRCIVQASASHGIKPGCRLRLWYWLDRAVTGDEMKRWLKPYPVDPCTFVTAQPIYTAAPVFIGCADHLPRRVAELPGKDEVAVPAPELLKPTETPRLAQQAGATEQASQERVQQIIDDALQRVRNASSAGKHYALRDNARLLGGIAGQAGLSNAYLIDQLVQALPSGVEDWDLARETAEWGLAIGREEPIEIPFEARSRKPDPRRQETARRAFRLLRAGVAGEDIIAALDEQNDKRDAPLPLDEVRETLRWAASRLRSAAHA